MLFCANPVGEEKDEYVVLDAESVLFPKSLVCILLIISLIYLIKAVLFFCYPGCSCSLLQWLHSLIPGNSKTKLRKLFHSSGEVLCICFYAVMRKHLGH